jgi:two-component system, NtrC family, response regulator AtoC
MSSERHPMKDEEKTEVRTERTVLVVDDEKTLRFTLAEAMRDEGYHTHEAANGGEAFSLLREANVDVVLLDLKLKESGEDGLTLLKRIKKDFPEVEVVMMTAYGKFEHAVEATRAGCYNFVGKPFQLDQIKLVVKGALHSASLRREVEILRRGVRGRFPTDQVIGQSEGLRQVMDTVGKVAKSRATVLLLGETGTGKEVIARAIHKRSDVAEGPFVALNCSAVPENLLESQLFGHEKGAFTDAKFRKKGDFELADRGTLFLDEIGDMAPGLQAKLLRVLETGAFKHLGGTGDIVVDVRVIAATHRDLKLAVAENRFREDLYFRLAVVPIHIPPLRERREDILPLARFFLDHLNREMGRTFRGFAPEAERVLQEYAWPGNVRELRNVVERAVLLSGGEEIDAAAMPLEVLAPVTWSAGNSPPAGVETWTLADWEKHAILLTLRRFAGNKTRAAESLKVARQTLRSKIREYGLGDAGEDD